MYNQEANFRFFEQTSAEVGLLQSQLSLNDLVILLGIARRGQQLVAAYEEKSKEQAALKADNSVVWETYHPHFDCEKKHFRVDAEGQKWGSS